MCRSANEGARAGARDAVNTQGKLCVLWWGYQGGRVTKAIHGACEGGNWSVEGRGQTGGQASFASMHAVGMCRTVREWAVPGFSRSVWVGFSLSEYNYTATNYNQPLPQALGVHLCKKVVRNAVGRSTREGPLMLPTILDIWPDNCPCGDPARYLFGTLGYTIWQSQNVLDNGKP